MIATVILLSSDKCGQLYNQWAKSLPKGENVKSEGQRLTWFCPGQRFPIPKLHMHYISSVEC